MEGEGETDIQEAENQFSKEQPWIFIGDLADLAYRPPFNQPPGGGVHATLAGRKAWARVDRLFLQRIAPLVINCQHSGLSLQQTGETAGESICIERSAQVLPHFWVQAGPSTDHGPVRPRFIVSKGMDPSRGHYGVCHRCRRCCIDNGSRWLSPKPLLNYNLPAS